MSATASYDDFGIRRTMVYSLLLHGLLAAAILGSAFLRPRGNPWGGIGGGGSVKVTLVGSSGGIPMPNPPVVTPSTAVDSTKGLYKEEPKPKTPEPPTDAKKIPQFEKNKRTPPPSRPSRVFESKTPPPDNAVPYGRGGQPNLPVGSGTNLGGATGPVSMAGQGGGDFAARYGWYIDATTRRIESNWNQWSLDAAARASSSLHCAVTFTINRDGSVKDVHITETSGNLSYDNAGLRAVLSSSPMPRLPDDYSGSYVVATYDFPRRR